MKNCNKCIFFEAKKKQDLYIWWGKHLPIYSNYWYLDTVWPMHFNCHANFGILEAHSLKSCFSCPPLPRGLDVPTPKISQNITVVVAIWKQWQNCKSLLVYIFGALSGISCQKYCLFHTFKTLYRGPVTKEMQLPKKC